MSYKLKNPPSTSAYVAAFKSIRSRMSMEQTAILQCQYRFPSRAATAKQLAVTADIRGGHPVVNAHYGRLGHMLANEMGFVPDRRDVGTHRWWAVLSSGWTASDRSFIWQMLPEVADALEILGWVAPDGEPLPEEIRLERPFFEGAVCRVIINAYERNPAARSACIAHYGTRCVACGFSFGEIYGEAGEGFVHVHHLHPLSDIRAEYVVDPIKDLRPVCANCHAIIHRRNPPYSIDEIRELLTSSSFRKSETSRPLHGKPLTLPAPVEPVAEEDWEAIR